MVLDKINSVGSRKLLCYVLIACYLLIPISSPVDFGSFQLNLPIEPILVISAILLFLFINSKYLISSFFLRHPLTLLSIFYHLWMIVSIANSTNFIVSAKYAIITCLHFIVFYFGSYYLLINKIDFTKVLFGFLISFTSIIVYSLIKFLLYNFDFEMSPDLSRPFYSDHTLFGASLAFLLPVLILYRFEFISPINSRLIWILLFCLAIFNTNSQAVWLSLIIGLISYFMIKKYNVNPIIIFSGGLTFVILSAILLHKVHQYNIERDHRLLIGNTQEKSLLFNLSTDVSTLERINRYSCAIRMMHDRPFWGFGTGTFQFAYLPYQKPSEMTRLSVTTSRRDDGRPHSSGKGGGVHSEFFQAFVELGIPGGLIWISIVIFSIYYAMKNYYSLSNRDHFSLAIIIALIGYFVHALFNNFLHNEEISFLFWSFIGFIVYSGSKKSSTR